jgi:hypothetical protein
MDTDPELKGVNFLMWFNQGDEIKKTLKRPHLHRHLRRPAGQRRALRLLEKIHHDRLLPCCAFPFSLIVACGVIWAQGKTLNTLSLLGLIVGIGMLVDNAVVVMENIFRYQEMGARPEDRGAQGRARDLHRRGGGHAHVGHRLSAHHLQQAQRGEHLPARAGHHRLPHAAGLALREPDPHSPGHSPASSRAKPVPRGALSCWPSKIVLHEGAQDSTLKSPYWLAPVIGLRGAEPRRRSPSCAWTRTSTSARTRASCRSTTRSAKR